MTKKETIKEAWGEHYDESIEENGFKEVESLLDVNLNNFDAIGNMGIYYIRPISLQGIEHNNGWIKIESEDDLPKENIECFYIPKHSKNIVVGSFRLSSYKGWKNMFTVDHNIAVGLGHVTHYQPIEKPKPPIY